jgi:predicted DNA-binding protein
MGSGKGRTVKTSSINLAPELWAKLDALRGDQSRSAWIAERIRRARK